MIGHNNGPPLGDISDVGGRARLYYWRKAHKAAWRTPPIEIVKLRHRAAEQLGLSYHDYTSILLDRGRRPSAIFFAFQGTLVRCRGDRIETDSEGSIALMPGVRRKLQSLGDCAVFVLADQRRARRHAGEDVDRCIRQVADFGGAAIADYAIYGAARGFDPPVQASTFDAVNDLLRKHRLVPSQAVLVGSSAEDEAAAQNAGLARFLWAWHYFAEGPAGSS